MVHVDLFSGIGGFALASECVWPQMKHVFCENDAFCQTILRKHWPDAPIYGDIKSFTNAKCTGQLQSEGTKQDKWQWPVNGVDLITGGFPCQPFSIAGERRGVDDARHLWPEMRRVIQEFAPRYVVAENVRGILSIHGGLVFEQVCLDLEALGYEVQPIIIPACAVNAPHRRDRVWFIAHSKSVRRKQGDSKRRGLREGESTEKERNRLTNGNIWEESWPQVATRLCRLDDGLPEGVARPKGWRNAALKAYGNAIVPQVAEQIFRTIVNTGL